MTATSHRINDITIDGYANGWPSVSIEWDEGGQVVIALDELQKVIEALQDCKRVLDLVVASL